ncbi:protein kinase [Candidatus Falkowbacteria bacterium]|nr:protein kinase [Candidatus Falkowbacteria bacterium]
MLATLTRYYLAPGLQSIDQQFVEKFKDNPKRQSNEASELAGLAYLAFVDLDPRAAEGAIEHFVRSGRADFLAELYRLAKLRRHFRLVWFAGQALGLADWQSEFTEWFKDEGLWWFDLFEDRGTGHGYIHPDDTALIGLIVQKLGLGDSFWQEVRRQAESRQEIPLLRRRLVSLLAGREEPAIQEVGQKDDQTDRTFRQFCSEQGIRILRCLQTGRRGLSACSWVYQALDNDGVIKIFKEVIEPEGRMPHSESEEAVYSNLGECDFLPEPYETETVSQNCNFLRQPFIYGQSLAPFVAAKRKMSLEQAKKIISSAAEKLAQLHRSGVAHLDLRPEHIIVAPEGLAILDLGLSRLVPDRSAMVDVVLRSPRYAAPEMGLHGQGGCATDIFQLGLVFYELLTGRHPFCLHRNLPEGDEDKAGEIIKYLVPAMALDFKDDLARVFDDPQLDILRQMLDKEPGRRPTAEEVAEALRSSEAVEYAPMPLVEARGNTKEANTVLFPARMSIPHHGHIEYIARLVELGYYVKISLQCSYILTEHDPVPKWLTMKMVAQSLFDRGISRENFEFVFTPLYATRHELDIHFRMMPGWENVIAVASGNPEVHVLFPGKLILDQKSVFGREQVQYENRSWGESLRQSIREGDQAAFKELAGSGVERILSFNELQQFLKVKQPIPFVSSRVSVHLVNSKREALAATRSFRYLSPEESLCRWFHGIGIKASVLDPYAKETTLLIKGKLMRLKYRQIEFEHGNEIIVFESA